MTAFTSLGFWAFLVPPALCAYWLTAPRWRSTCLMLLSMAYYAAVDPANLPLLALQIGIAFAVGRRLARAATDAARMAWLLTGLVPVVGALVLFKLGDGVVSLIAPLGVSYYTFKLIAYLVEIFWDESQEATSFVEFAAFVSFAPQMVSGPIQRPADFLGQIARLRAPADPGCIEDGFRLLLNGLLLKLLVGDRLGAFITQVDAAPQTYSRQVVVLTMLCYLPWLYADFCGYTNIALGLGKLFGITGPPNFNAPFSASNIQDYWRRWHMSLTGWLTDYVFMPLRMQTRRMGQAGLVLSVFVNMILVGLWHKIAWTFFTFGVIQGAHLSISALTLRARDDYFARWPRLRPVRRLWGMAVNFLLMAVSMTIWHAASMQSAMLHFSLALGLTPDRAAGADGLPGEIAVLPPIVCMLLAIYHGLGAPGFGRASLASERYVPVWVWQGVKLLLISALSTTQGGAFIYGQF